MLAVAAPGDAGAAPERPIGLAVKGAGYGWQHSNSLELTWRNPPGVAAVGFRIADALGAIVRSGRVGRPEEFLRTSLPSGSAVYAVEVWLEDSGGARGPSAGVTVRLDMSRPNRLADPALPAWLGRAAFPLRLKLGQPAAPAPLSGIHGYAIAIAPAPPGHPCPGNAPCGPSRVLAGVGPERDAVTIAALPGGRHHLSAVAVSGAGLPASVPARALLAVDTTDPVTVLEGAPDGWASGPVRIRVRAADGGAGMAPLPGLPQPFTAVRVGAGAPIRANGPSVAAVLIEEGRHAVAHYARDAAGNVADGARVDGVANPAPAVATVRIDRTPPRIAFAAQNPRDPESIRAVVADRLSGAVSRGWIGARPAGSPTRFAPLPAEPAPAGELRARWDSGALPAGRYEFRAFGRDAAGNAGFGERRAGGAPMVLTAPLKAATRIDAGLPGGRAERQVRFGRGVVFAGRLGSGARAGLAAATVRVIERFAPGAATAVRTTPVRTDARGRFRLRLAPGPSRSVEAEFGGGPAQSRASSAPARLRVRGDVRLSASSRLARIGGAPVVFSGRVAAGRGEIPPGGKSVQLQFRLPGLEWSEFRTVQTDRRGRFRYAYRFSDDDSRGVRFLFRAHAPAQAGWPYDPGSSWPVAVSGG